MAEEVLRLEDVWVHYGGVPVLEGINLSVERGDFLGIVGPNGGGKTTLLKVILGLVEPTCGRVLVFGGPPQKGRGKIGYVPQNAVFELDFPISVEEVVLMGRWGGILRRFMDEDRVAAWKALEMVGMLEYKDKQIGRLSGGERQRVFIARALASNPKILLLDEPMASVDLAKQTLFYELLEGLRERGITILLVSHDIGAITAYANKIACLNRRLFYHGSNEITYKVLEDTYKCPIQLIAHGAFPHRVLGEHRDD